MLAAGLHFWQLGESYYWGHNAILRVEPFMRHCALSRLPGRPPFGGEILSHDFVEAALLRRAGWAVRMLPTLGGSWEDSPPSLLDVAARDRRWAQGRLRLAEALADEFAGQYFYLHFVSDSSVTKWGFEIAAEYAN